MTVPISTRARPNRGGRPSSPNGLYKAEAAVLALHDAGVPRSQIEASGQFSMATIQKAYGLMSEQGSINQECDIRSGTDALGKRIDFVAGAQAFARKYEGARHTSATAKIFFALDRPVPVLRHSATRALLDQDPRPFAASREPCRLCQIRGDIGCAHQRPFQPSLEEDCE